ncbi:MAG: Oligopeptide transport ATP-binding protein OppD, partial [uncultured Friedmanniella sp.]
VHPRDPGCGRVRCHCRRGVLGRHARHERRAQPGRLPDHQPRGLRPVGAAAAGQRAQLPLPHRGRAGARRPRCRLHPSLRRGAGHR